ncbi:hypothetical protein [Demequina subtropica]|uniref:hypothetical protein n=1 Tax=Demequina subtropica TaxID=1638989 RepID=UPI000785AAE8|nr:hypothetical protein [Demequina subtropica]
MRVAAGALAALALAAGLAGCSSPTDTDLPDLSGLGLTSTSCEDTVQMSGIATGEEDAVLECWVGSPEATFLDTADSILDLLLDANGSAEDVSGALCWSDTVTDAEASACRAVLVGDTESGTLVSAVVSLVDPADVIGAISDDPADAEVEAALAGAALEVLVFSEPVSAEVGDLTGG